MGGRQRTSIFMERSKLKREEKSKGNAGKGKGKK